MAKTKTRNSKRIYALATLACILCFLPFLGENKLRSQSLEEATAPQVTAQLSNSSRPTTDNFFCFNVNSVQVQSWQNQRFLTVANRLSPGILRLPGGTVANYWNWRRGGLIQNINSLPEGLPQFLRFAARQYTQGKLANFKATLQATNSVPIFVLNLLTDTLESQLRMLRAARDLGIPIQYIELGNEFFFDIANYRNVFPTPEDYAVTAVQWVTAIKQEFPNADVAVISTLSEPGRSPRFQNWNTQILNSALPAVDAITLHIYEQPGIEQTTISSETAYPFFTASNVPTILGEPFRNWQNIQADQDYNLIPEDKDIWVTEYNLIEDLVESSNEQTPKVMGSWAHGLFALSMGLLFLEDPQIQIACNHVLIEDFKFGAIFADERGFAASPAGNIPVEQFDLSATGTTLRLLGETIDGMTTAQKIEFSGSPVLVGRNSFRYPALYGWMFSRANTKRGIIMNLSNQTIQLDLSSVFPQKFRYEQVSGTPRILVTNPNSLNTIASGASTAIFLPPYSVTRIY